MKGFSIPVVHNCPYTKAGSGVMHINHKTLGVLAGAVHDKIEWMAFLIGTRSQDGLEVTVTDLRVPEQNRSTGHCETFKEEPLPPDVVGVVHSHHSMGAFFSQTDVDKLNPRFPTSIVISQLRHDAIPECKLLGFNYKAEGRAPLPCGSIGVIDFTVQPTPMVKDWPVVALPKFDKPVPGTLHWCPKKKVETGHLIQRIIASCGVSTSEPTKAVFGTKSQEFIVEVEKKTKGTGMQEWVPGQGYNQNYYVTDKRHQRYIEVGGPWSDDDFLRHWSNPDRY